MPAPGMCIRRLGISQEANPCAHRACPGRRGPRNSAGHRRLFVGRSRTGIEPVTGFEVERYMGRWYEVARLDHSFERGMEQVTATYELRAGRHASPC